jgi:hypothetical protein
MNNLPVFWIAMSAYAIHMMEEFFYNWKDWANNVLGLPVDWAGFYVTNTAVLFLGIACASTGWSMPWFALAFPALMLINAIFFHIVPFIVKRKNSPGLITAVLLFLPISLSVYKTAIDMGVGTTDIIISFVIGALLMAFPIVLLKTKNLPFFKQS